ncbi:GPW/gp25 family protein [Ideonella sp. DXS29W]|uniref:GPW/gp25 family protein n=1 Tax=Ideonella lacteola TaxID=2984193 RepID=A0ABU9BYH1_9BURK
MSFLGRGWSFPPRFDNRQHVVMVEHEEDIEESLRILFRTRVGERVMQHGYGTRLHQMVFQEVNQQTITEMTDMLKKAVMYFEPRIKLEQLDVRPNPDDLARLDVLLRYRVRTTNTRHNMVYPLYLDQASHPVQAG